MLKCNRVKRSGEEKKKAGKIIDFTLWTVLVLGGRGEDGVIGTLVNCEDVCRMMDRCHH